MKMESFLAAGMMFFSLAAATPVVTSVTAQQRYPWNGNVDIVVTLSGASNDVARAECVFAATNSATKAALPISHITLEEGAVGSGTTWTRRFVTGKGTYASKSIFLPAAGGGSDSFLSDLGSYGRYRSSTPYSGSFYYAWGFYFFRSGVFDRNCADRCSVQSVRPLRDFAK